MGSATGGFALDGRVIERDKMETKRVLLVDDEPNVIQCVADGLEMLGNQIVVETAGAGGEALAKAQQTQYALLITDYWMPDMTGLELAYAVRRLSPEIQILFMTAYGREGLREAAVDLGIVGFLDKPFTMAQIRELVGRAVRGSS
jgi:CheY-like chemotaxis protein